MALLQAITSKVETPLEILKAEGSRQLRLCHETIHTDAAQTTIIITFILQKSIAFILQNDSEPTVTTVKALEGGTLLQQLDLS